MIPPMNAPGMEPMPPSTAATKALMPGMAPVVGVSVGYAEHIRIPPIAASAEPMAKVIEMVLLTSTPMRVAAPLSSETASIACPAFVLLMKVTSPPTMIRQHRIVTMVSPEIVSAPPASLTGLIGTKEVKLFGFAPNRSSATF